MEIETTSVFEIDIVCTECGKELDVDQYHGKLYVSHCDDCYNDRHKQSYDEGYEDGKNSIEKEESV